MIGCTGKPGKIGTDGHFSHLRCGPRLRRLCALWDPIYGLAHLLAREVELTGALQVHPEVGRHAEILREAERCVRRDVPLSGENLIQTIGRHLDHVGQLLGGKTDLLKLVGEDLSGGEWACLEKLIKQLSVGERQAKRKTSEQPNWHLRVTGTNGPLLRAALS